MVLPIPDYPAEKRNRKTNKPARNQKISTLAKTPIHNKGRPHKMKRRRP
jgi:hypothetical protein